MNSRSTKQAEEQAAAFFVLSSAQLSGNQLRRIIISKESGASQERPRSYLELAFGGDWIRQAIDRTGEKVLDGMAYEASLHLQITRSLFLSTQLLGETRENQYNLDVLVGYYFGAGNIIQLSYKKSAQREALAREGGHSLTLKVSYLLRI